MRRECVLCGGKIKDGICTECGMDNRKSDEMYYQAMQEKDCAQEGLTHVHREEGQAETYRAPELNRTRRQEEEAYRKEKGEEKRKKSGSRAQSWETVRKKARTTAFQRAGLQISEKKKSQGILTTVIVLAGLLITGVNHFQGEAVVTGEEAAGNYEVYLDEDIDPETELDIAYPWENISGEGLNETGESWEAFLSAGSYLIGTDIPQGIYTLQGEDGMVYRVDDREHMIYALDFFSQQEDLGIAEAQEVKLFAGALVQIEGAGKVRFSTANAQLDTLKQRTANPLTGEVEIPADEDVQIAGEEFPAGTYDVSPVAGGMADFYCDLSGVADGAFSWEIYLSMGEEYNYQTPVYKNMVIPEGAGVRAEFCGIRLIPSQEIVSEDYTAFYENALY